MTARIPIPWVEYLRTLIRANESDNRIVKEMLRHGIREEQRLHRRMMGREREQEQQRLEDEEEFHAWARDVRDQLALMDRGL